MPKAIIYLIGSLRNPKIPEIANYLRTLEFEVFDDWYSPGPEADDYWRDYEKNRGSSYQDALKGYAGEHIYSFDKFHLNRAHAGVCVYPAGKSGHLELGYLSATGKPGFILLDETPDRYDVMKQFASGGLYFNKDELGQALLNYKWPKVPDMPKMYASNVMWLAGLLEGEGCFQCDSLLNTKKLNPRPRIQLMMTDEDIVSKVAKQFETSYWKLKKKENRKQVYGTAITGARAAEWMRILKPYMGQRRQLKIQEILNKWNLK